MSESIAINVQPDPGIEQLIEQAQSDPPKPLVEGLWNKGETAGLHGPPEVFKTICCLQLTESLATGQPLFGIWPTHKPRMIYFFETEMSVSALGRRLLNMFDGKPMPRDVRFASEARLRQFKKVPTITAKFELLNIWVTEAGADVVIIDTCNPFFRGKESGNDETAAGEFFDRLDELSASTKLFVRHNRKPRDDEQAGDAVAKIKGSGQFSEVPDLLWQLTRTDKRTNEARLSVTKHRHGSKGREVTLWFDSRDFRLISLPPVIHVLRDGGLSRADLLKALARRFDVGERHGDAMILSVRDYLEDVQRGHQKVFQLDPDAITATAPWASQLQL